LIPPDSAYKLPLQLQPLPLTWAGRLSERTAGNVTQLLNDWAHGDRNALDRLVPLVYSELRRLSRYYLSRGRFHASLQTTALINEAFVRLIDQNGIGWENRAHFFGIAARTMRNILVDHARKRYAQKRGRSEDQLLFDERVPGVNQEKGLGLVALDDALTSLSEIDPELSRLVELRFFGGLTVRETAVVLGVSPATVKRSWRTAKIWLHRELNRS
jgi:RNA polymerase sigma factor (TIGR02999 family)